MVREYHNQRTDPVYANKGFLHGNKKSKQASNLPWWKFEILARLLGGER